MFPFSSLCGIWMHANQVKNKTPHTSLHMIVLTPYRLSALPILILTQVFEYPGRQSLQCLGSPHQRGFSLFCCMHLKSLYPEIPPLPPLLNAFLVLLGRPDQDKWADYTAHVETNTGRTLSFVELRKRINDLATALGAPTSRGGLELRPGTGALIGIMSDNSSVSVYWLDFLWLFE